MNRKTCISYKLKNLHSSLGVLFLLVLAPVFVGCGLITMPSEQISNVVHLSYGMSEKSVTDTLKTDGIVNCWFRVGGINYKSNLFYYYVKPKDKAHIILEYDALFKDDSLVAFANKQGVCDCLSKECFLTKKEKLLKTSLSNQTEHSKKIQEYKRKISKEDIDGAVYTGGMLMSPAIAGITVLIAGTFMLPEWLAAQGGKSCASDWYDAKQRGESLVLGTQHDVISDLVERWGYYHFVSKSGAGKKTITIESEHGCPHMLLVFENDELLSVKATKYK